MSSPDSRRRAAVESLNPAIAADWQEGRGRTLAQIELETGFTTKELVGAKGAIVDFGAGPTAEPLIEIAEAARKAGVQPPHLVALSAGYIDPARRAHLDAELERRGVSGDIDVRAEYADETTLEASSASHLIAVHIFEHLADEDIAPAAETVLKTLAHGGRAVIAKYPVPKSFLDSPQTHPSIRERIDSDPAIIRGRKVASVFRGLVGRDSGYRMSVENAPTPAVMRDKWFEYKRIAIERKK